MTTKTHYNHRINAMTLTEYRTRLSTYIIGLFCLIALFISTTISAETAIYKWQDAQGRTHYSATPPPTVQQNNDISETIQRYSGQAIPIDQATQATNDTDNQLKSLNAATNNETSDSASYCTQQQQSLNVLQNNKFVKWQMNDEEIILEGEAKAAKTAALQKEISKYCTNNNQ